MCAFRFRKDQVGIKTVQNLYEIQSNIHTIVYSAGKVKVSFPGEIYLAGQESGMYTEYQ
jgi:hypothetical protein